MPAMNALRNHAVIAGYGRVGRAVGEKLARNGMPFVAIEEDIQAVAAIRKRGVPAFFGDASRRKVLEEAAIADARLLIVTAPDPYKARAIITAARLVNPGIDTVVRTHSESERVYLERMQVGMAVMGERELANAMARYALTSVMPAPGAV
jgi:CPA2 family monovalent cation:H+ antiporter-2